MNNRVIALPELPLYIGYRLFIFCTLVVRLFKCFYEFHGVNYAAT